MTKEKCETCRYFARWSSNLLVGHCHRFPPTAKDKREIDQADAFPVVTPDAWCGEYQEL